MWSQTQGQNYPKPASFPLRSCYGLKRPSEQPRYLEGSPMWAGTLHPGLRACHTHRGRQCQKPRGEVPVPPQKGQSTGSLGGQAAWRPFTHQSPRVRKVLFFDTYRTGHYGMPVPSEEWSFGTQPCSSAWPLRIIQTVRHSIQAMSLNFPNSLCSVVERVGLGFRQAWVQTSFYHSFRNLWFPYLSVLHCENRVDTTWVANIS